MSHAEKFARSCAEAAKYPQNIVHPNAYDHYLASCVERLDEHEKRLFFDESRASLSIRDYSNSVELFKNQTLCSYEELCDYLKRESSLDHSDPQCRFVFVHAPHSRERLRTTRNMLMYIFTYHQVMPEFVDFLFQFGRQMYAQDFQFSGFSHGNRLAIDERGLSLPELGRSGRDIQMCYNLKSVEPSKGQTPWPWSVRHTAAYHSFDVETGKSFWVMIKGDQLMKKRIEAATKNESSLALRSLHSLVNSFASSLAAHLVIFDWCRENWRWYINFLENGLQKSTRQSLLVDLGSSRRQQPTPAPVGEITRITSSKICPSPVAMVEKGTFDSGSQTKRPPPYAPSARPPLPMSSAHPGMMGDSDEESSSDEEEDQFSFGDLQRVQFLEEKANEISLVLESNIKVISEVMKHYQETFASEDCAVELTNNCSRDLARFVKATASIVSDLQMQQSRTKMLLQLLTDRKSLLYGILDYRNMESNKGFAKRAQMSTENMEAMTVDMHHIAQKTKQETVSMRIITLVTLFFLPGTFISVQKLPNFSSCFPSPGRQSPANVSLLKTIMSTDIVQYQLSDAGKSQEIFQLGALQLYMAITAPLMVITFGSWYGVYWWVDRKEAARDRKNKLKGMV